MNDLFIELLESVEALILHSIIVPEKPEYMLRAQRAVENAREKYGPHYSEDE